MANFYPVGSDNLDGTPDIIAGPVFLTGPTLTTVSHGIYSVNYSLDVGGDDCGAVVVPAGSTAPSVIQILAGQNSSGTAAIGAATDAYGSGNDTFNISGGTLVPGVTYDIYIAATNGAGGESSIYPFTLKLLDSVAPKFIDAGGTEIPALGAYAGGTAAHSAGGSVSFRFDEDCTYIVITVPTGQSPEPTAEEIFAGSVPNTVFVKSPNPYATSVDPAPEPNIGLSGHAPSTTYDVYVAARDSSNNYVRNGSPYVLTTTAGVPTFVGPNFSDISLSVGVFFTIDTSTYFTGEVSYTTTAPTGDGMSFNTGTGVYSGTPTAEFSSSSVTFRAVNGSGTTQSNGFNVTSVDAPATFTAGPTISAYTEVGSTVSFTSDQAGTYYVVAVPYGESPPTAANVKAGDKFGGADAPFASTAALVADTNTPVVITGLTAGTIYTAYVVLNDGNSDTPPEPKDFTTSSSADNTPPVLTSVSKTLITTTSAQVRLESNEVGNYRIVIMQAGAALPTAAEILGGTGASAAAPLFLSPLTVLPANTIVSYDFSGLTHSTAYHAFIAIEDAAGNTDSSFNALAITTTTPTDTVAPVFLSGPTLVSTTESVITYTFTMDSVGQYRAVTVPTGSSPPTATEVFAGQGSGGSVPSGVIALTGMYTGKSWDIGIGQLDSSTTYDTYIALRDESNNEMVSVALTATTKAAAVAAPTYLGGFSPQSNTLGQTASLNIAVYFTGVGNTYSLNAGSLPDGITLNSNGLITGTFTKVQSAGSIRVAATNGSGIAYTQYFNWTVVSPSGGAKFTGVLRTWNTNEVYSNAIGVRMFVTDTFGGTPINSTVAVFNTNALGEFDVTLAEAIAGSEYYVLKESPDGVITSLQKDTAEPL